MPAKNPKSKRAGRKVARETQAEQNVPMTTGTCGADAGAQSLSRQRIDGVSITMPPPSESVVPYYYRGQLLPRHVVSGFIDIYDLLDEVFIVHDDEVKQAIKKLIAAGHRGMKDRRRDIYEALIALHRWHERHPAPPEPSTDSMAGSVGGNSFPGNPTR